MSAPDQGAALTGQAGTLLGHAAMRVHETMHVS